MTDTTRRQFLKQAGLFGGLAVGGSALLGACASGSSSSSGSTRGGSGGASGPIKVGIVTDLTGAYAPFGQAQLNTITMEVDELNKGSGVSGRQLALITADSASSTNTAASVANKMITQHQPDVIIGGLSGATVAALIGVIAKRARIPFICPMQEPAGLCDPYYFGTGVVPEQYATPLVPWLIKNGGKRFYLPGSNYNFPRDTNYYVKRALASNGGTVVGEEYFPLDATDFSATVEKIMSQNVDVVFNTVIPPGFTSFFTALHDAGFLARGGRLACPFFDDLLTSTLPAATFEGLASCWDYFEALDDSFDKQFLARYNKRFPKGPPFSGTAAGAYRANHMYAVAVEKAGSTDADAVTKALSTAALAHGPGGASQMSGNSCKLTMHVGVAHNGKFQIAEDLGLIDPDYACDASS